MVQLFSWVCKMLQRTEQGKHVGGFYLLLSSGICIYHIQDKNNLDLVISQMMLLGG